MSVLRIKKNDVVIAMVGANAGKTGKILQIIPARGRAIVEGVNLRKKCVRKSNQNPQGGIIEKETTISMSNLLLYCPQCKKGVKARRVSENDKKIRKCGKCGHAFDT